MPRTELLPGGRLRPYLRPGSANDPVANAARAAAAAVIEAARAYPADTRGSWLRAQIERLRPGAAAWVEQQTQQQQLDRGVSAAGAFHAALAALLANEYLGALVTGTMPAWWGRPGELVGLGGVFDDIVGKVKDGLEAVVCADGAGEVAGAMTGGSAGAAAGAVGQNALQNLVGCGSDKKVPVPAATPVPEAWYEQIPAWAWAVGSVVAVGGVGAIVYFATKKG